MKGTNAILLSVFAVVALAYVLLISCLPFPGSWLIKALPIWCLAVVAFRNIDGATGKLIGLGFVLSSVGDIALNFQLELAFMIGLGFFLLAHVTYTIAFSLKMQFRPARIPFQVLVVAAATTMAILLAPHLGAMAIPVFAYLTVITVMVIFSSLREDVSPLLMLGGFIFMASDSMIAVGKFITPFPGAKYGVMITYYLAQFLILWAFMPPSTPSNALNSTK